MYYISVFKMVRSIEKKSSNVLLLLTYRLTQLYIDNNY